MFSALRPVLALALLAGLSPSAIAGEKVLMNDSFSDGDTATFQGGFVSPECWASVYVPGSSDYPFTMKSVDMLVGGDNTEVLMIVEFYSMSDTDMTRALPEEQRESEL